MYEYNHKLVCLIKYLVWFNLEWIVMIDICFPPYLGMDIVLLLSKFVVAASNEQIIEEYFSVLYSVCRYTVKIYQ